MSNIIPNTISELLDSGKKDLDIEQKIVAELLNESNLDCKTELEQPLKWTVLNILSDYLDGKKLLLSANILKRFREIAFKFLISKDRKGRLEYIQALQTIREKNDIEKKNLSMKVD